MNKILLLLLLPMLGYAQPASIVADTIGKTSRINFIGPTQSIQIGDNSGNTFSTGLANILIGNLNGTNNSTGGNNIAIGSSAGVENSTGSSNINLGVLAGSLNQSGFGNVNIGDGAGYVDDIGVRNVRIGYLAGANARGSDNILIGNSAGYFLQGSNKLEIGNDFNKPSLISGDFEEESVTINGDLNVTGDITGILASEPIDIDQVSGALGNGASSSFLEVLDNTVLIEITGIVTGQFLITKSIGFQIDTFTINPGPFGTRTGFNSEYPLVFETDDASDIAALNNWFNNPSWRSLAIIIKDVAGLEKFRYQMFEYQLSSISQGSDGRTSFTLTHRLPPDRNNTFELAGSDFGAQASYNAATDKVVEITGISHLDFSPAVDVDYANRVVTLEMTYEEGAGLYAWVNATAEGEGNKTTMSIIETINGPGSTVISRENFFEVLPFQYELIYGFGLNSKLKARVKIFYGFSEPG